MQQLNDISVSVIVPVYNVEKYLARCIQSILDQKHTNLEIILVDDGSPDSSGKIIDTFAEKDSRIIPIHKQNGGVSSARNAGLDTASGEYVLFVDADDHIEPEYTDYFLQLLLTGGGAATLLLILIISASGKIFRYFTTIYTLRPLNRS
ncbi:MAG: glycosyltransferase [Synergistaceae bacterium]|nr:glycosyltransferase [Synergistaceae bacterium]